jgi:hypothetical protein
MALRPEKGRGGFVVSETIKRLEARLAEVERQLAALQTDIRTERSVKQPWWERAGRDYCDDESFHQMAQKVQKIIEKNRQADRKRVIAEIERQEKREKAAKAKRKPSTGGAKARRAG